MVRQDPRRPPSRPQTWLLGTLGLSATNPTRYAWESVLPGDRDYMTRPRRLLRIVADRITRQHAPANHGKKSNPNVKISNPDGVPVTEHQSPLITVRSGTPRHADDRFLIRSSRRAAAPV